jgi:hypothetical protein
MTSLPSIPKRAIISIQPDPMGPFEFMNVNDAKEMLNSRHVGGIKRKTLRRNKRSGDKRSGDKRSGDKRSGGSFIIANSCGSNPGSCGNKLRGGKPSSTKRLIRHVKRRKSKRTMKNV